MTEEKTKKPRRVRKVAEKLDRPMTKSETTVAAGRVQTRVNNIVKNHAKSLLTASSRIDLKYSQLVHEEIAGLDFQVVALLDLPEFAAVIEAPEVDVVVEEAAE